MGKQINSQIGKKLPAQSQNFANISLTSSLKKIAAHCLRYKAGIIFVATCALISSILSLAAPKLLSSLTDMITEGIKSEMNLSAIAATAAILLALYILSCLFSVAQGFATATASQNISRDLRNFLTAKINLLPLSFFRKTSTGDMISRMTNDVDNLGQSIAQMVTVLAGSGLMFVGSIVLMLVTSPLLALFVLAIGAANVALMLFVTKHSRKYFFMEQQDLGTLNGYIEESYTGHTIIKAFGKEREAQNRFDTLNENLVKDGLLSQTLSGLMIPLSSFIGNLMYVAVCVLGGALVLRGNITIGAVIAFLAYTNYFKQPISILSQLLQLVQGAAASGERIFTLLEETEVEEENCAAGKISTMEACGTKGAVEFNHVSFGYNKNQPVIKDFSAAIKPGAKVAIVGPTGAGKTTLVNLLMRFYETDSGTISIDGKDIKTLSRKEVRDLFGMVLQDTWLFDGTLRENLAFNTSGITDTKLDEAAKATGLDFYVSTLPLGYDTEIDGSTNLSQGQKQQITIARAMLADRPMLILDEATSSVDTRTEVLVQNAMDSLCTGRTSFVIAHRLSTIQNADLILVMKDGNIEESGTHEELLLKGGFYAELYGSQFEEEV